MWFFGFLVVLLLNEALAMKAASRWRRMHRARRKKSRSMACEHLIMAALITIPLAAYAAMAWLMLIRYGGAYEWAGGKWMVLAVLLAWSLMLTRFVRKAWGMYRALRVAPHSAA